MAYGHHLQPGGATIISVYLPICLEWQIKGFHAQKERNSAIIPLGNASFAAPGNAIFVCKFVAMTI